MATTVIPPQTGVFAAFHMISNQLQDGRPLEGKRVLALTSEFPPFRGGIATYAINMAKAAVALGAAVTVLAPNYGDSSIQDGGQPFRIIRYDGGMPTTRQLFSRIRSARSAIRQQEYDIIHAMDQAFFIPAALSAGPKSRRIFVLHGSDINYLSSHRQHVLHSLAGALSGRSEFIANSAYTLDLLRQKLPNITPLSRRYEHLGVDAFWAIPVERSAAVRIRFGIPQEKFILITVGRLIRRKGQLQVLQALNRLPEPVRERIAYLIVGPETDKPYTAEVDAEIEKAKFVAMRLTGISNQDLRLLYANADAFCLVGQDAGDEMVEGFGLVFLEAASQRLPAIAGAVGAVPEVVLDRITGILVRSEDQAALADAVVELVNDAGLREKMAENAYAHAARFTWQECARKTYGPA